MARDYVIRVRGRHAEALLETFDRLASRTSSFETTLSGPIRDQAELNALLARIDELGLELVELRRLPRRAGDD